MQEHEKIPYNSQKYLDLWKEGMRLPDYRKGLERWFFQWQWRNPQPENSDKIKPKGLLALTVFHK